MNDRREPYSHSEEWKWQGNLRTDLKALLIMFFLCGLLTIVLLDQAFGHSTDLVRQSIHKLSDPECMTVDEKDVRVLEQGQPIKRNMELRQRHLYRLTLGAGQFVKIIVEQQGIDVGVEVSGPDGKQIAEFDSETRLQGAESVSLVAEAAGAYRLTVEPIRNATAKGDYEIRIEELRAATENDKALHEALKFYREYRVLRLAGKYDAALPFIERAIEIRERILGPDHPDVTAARNGLALLSWIKGEYAKAESLFEYVLEVRQRTLGAEHPDVAHSLNNLANLYKGRGAYAKAESLYQRALDIKEKVLGPEHPDLADSLNNLANLYLERGEYARAESLHQRTITIREQVLGLEHPDLAAALKSLATLYRDQGNYGSAEPLYQRALGIEEKVLGGEHINVAGSLNNLAILYLEKGEHAKAEPLFQRALGIRERVLGQRHPAVAASLKSLGLLSRYNGDYAKAELLYRRALTIQENAQGLPHPSVAASLNDLAALCAATGDFEEAVAFQSRANAVIEHNLTLNLAAGSERQKLAYLAALSKHTDQTVSLHTRYAPRNPAARDLAITVILQRKGRALDATSETLNALRSRFDPEDKALLDQLNETRSQIARLVLSGPQNMGAERYRDRLKLLEDGADRIEADISKRSNEFRAQSLPITLAAVQAAIPAGAALIEFALYRPFNARAVRSDEVYGQPRYVAYVIRQRGEVRWKDLGEGRAIDAAVASLREALCNPKRNDARWLARMVDRRLFQPLRPLLGGIGQLLISPEGSLNLVPFAALIDARGRYLVERWSISYLTSGRDLLRLQVPRESKSPPLVMADPDFGMPQLSEDGRRLKRAEELTKVPPREEPTETSFSQFHFSALPHTAHEGKALRALLRDATLLTRREASKIALSQVRSPLLLHIATHGFFLDDLNPGTVSRASVDEPSRLLRQLEKSGAVIESPLLRSGLALAGANEQKKEDNGILTALEVTGLNLWGTKLVVLSACDTGVGEVKKGEGVYGLRRALVLAGAETQVMSLWPVSDKGTQELMVSYYSGLKRGEGRGEALRRVQLKMLKEEKRKHPYYWASFIQSGEWANLEGKR